MKTFKVINTIKRIMLSISCIMFFLSAVSIDSADIGFVLLLGIIAIVSAAAGIFLERVIVVYCKDVNYSPIFTCNEEIVYENEVINEYYVWLNNNHAQDTDDNFDYFYNKYVA